MFDIKLSELADLVGDVAINLVTVIDAGWTFPGKGVPSSGRVAPPDERPEPVTRHFALGRDTTVIPQVGALSIYQGGIRTAVVATGPLVVVENVYPVAGETNREEVHGELTYGLVRALMETDPHTLTYRRLVKAIREKGHIPFVLSDDVEQVVFSNRIKAGAVRALLAGIRQAPLRRAIEVLQRLIEQRNGVDPEGHLNLGLAYDILDDRTSAPLLVI